MAFEKLEISSIANQQVANERIQSWQYETADGEDKVIATNYFEEMAKSLHINDQIRVLEKDGGNLRRRYDLTVRVNEEMPGANLTALLALPELVDASTHVHTFTDLATVDEILVALPRTSAVVAAYATFLGVDKGGSASVALAVKTVNKSTTQTTVFSGTLSGVLDYGQTLALTAGSADTDTEFAVTMTPTNLGGNPATLRLFLMVKDA